MVPPSVRSYLETPSFNRIAPIVSEKKSLKHFALKFTSLSCVLFSRAWLRLILVGNHFCKFWPWAAHVEQKVCLSFSVAGGRDGRTICSAFPWGQCVAAAFTAEVGWSERHNQAPCLNQGCQHCTSGHPGAFWDKHGSGSQNLARILAWWQNISVPLKLYQAPLLK